MRAISDPNRSDLSPKRAIQVLEQRLVGLLGKAIGMCADDGHRACHRGDVIEQPVFFDSQFQRSVLGFNRMRILPDVLAGENVLRDREDRGRHLLQVVKRCLWLLFRRRIKDAFLVGFGLRATRLRATERCHRQSACGVPDRVQMVSTKTKVKKAP